MTDIGPILDQLHQETALQARQAEIAAAEWRGRLAAIEELRRRIAEALQTEALQTEDLYDNDPER